MAAEVPVTDLVSAFARRTIRRSAAIFVIHVHETQSLSGREYIPKKEEGASASFSASSVNELVWSFVWFDKLVKETTRAPTPARGENGPKIQPSSATAHGSLQSYCVMGAVPPE